MMSQNYKFQKRTSEGNISHNTHNYPNQVPLTRQNENIQKIASGNWASVVRNGKNKNLINPWNPNSFCLPLFNRWNAFSNSEN